MLHLELGLLVWVSLYSVTQSETVSCDEKSEIRDTTQSFTFPSNKAADFTKPCSLTFAAQNDDRIKLVFPDLQKLNKNGSSCSDNYVKFANEQSGLTSATAYCNGILPSPFMSQNNMVFIQYKIQNSSVNSFTVQLTPIKSAQICGTFPATFDGTQTEFVFPLSGQTLQDNSVCTYQTRSKSGSRLTAKITSIKIGSSEKCTNDYVVFGSKSTLTANQDYTKCGTQVPQDNYTSTGADLFWQIKVSNASSNPTLKVTIKSGTPVNNASIFMVFGLLVFTFGSGME